MERPLREFAGKNREMQALSTIQGNLGAMAKEIDAAHDKLDKLKKKGAKASAGKVANATLEVETATTQWDSQAPFVFESLQAADETRVNHLRDVLTQFQTHEVDQVERNRVTAENCLNALLNVETADEIKSFASRTLGGKSQLRTQRRKSLATGTGTGTRAPDPLPPPPPIPAADDNASQRSRESGGAPLSGSGKIRYLCVPNIC